MTLLDWMLLSFSVTLILIWFGQNHLLTLARARAQRAELDCQAAKERESAAVTLKAYYARQSKEKYKKIRELEEAIIGSAIGKAKRRKRA